MAYITLEELKKILPDILDQWIDKDDESWEWIFQEIEQKCHVGKKKKEPVNCETCKYFVSNNGVGYCDGGMPCYGHSQWEKKKDKKPKKKDMQNAMEIAIMAHRNDINECNRKITNLSDVYTEKVQQMQLTINDLRAEVMHLRSEITAAKSMAETAKQRTEVDYSKYSGKSDGKISYGGESKCCATCKYGGTGADVCVGCGYEHWEAKENE